MKISIPVLVLFSVSSGGCSSSDEQAIPGGSDAGATRASDGGSQLDAALVDSEGGLCFFPAQSVVFPGTVVGSPPSTSAFSFGTAYVRGCGTDAVSVSRVRLSATSDPAFRISFPPFTGDSTTVEAGSTMAVELEFAPESIASVYSGELEIEYGSGQVKTIALVGAGIADPGTCVVHIGPTLVGGPESTTSAFDLGDTPVGESLRMNFLVSNVSRSPCTLNSLTLTGPSASAFSFPYPTQVEGPIPLNFRQLKIIDVEFTPDAIGDFLAEIALNSNDVGAAERTLQLSAQGK